ncbi:hypothetical protein [Nocardioides silvaticus]|uniref:hypothetical protein n=1 Tax=Nocardioides silvaticus TaxID=2201891 RepID=UPI001FE2C686|nr:hypothetical protein [Nocardioides silvaticus]
MIANRSRGGLRRLVAPAVVLLALTLSGCGDEEDDGGVASAGGDASASGDTADPAGMDDRDRMLAFAGCLRDNGLDVDDPAEGEGLQLKFGPETDRATVEAAMEACREFAPEGGPGGGRIDSETMLEFAECMRANGVEAFPDPDPDQGGMMIDRDIAEDPDFEAAQEACKDILGDLAPGGGA